jgi:hypothetical protein
MADAIGMYRLIRYSATPTTISTITRFIKGIFLFPQDERGNPQAIAFVAPLHPQEACSAIVKQNVDPAPT